MEQKTEEWFAARLGKVTASRIKDVLAGKTTAARRNYMAQLVIERMTQHKPDAFTNAAMQWGTDQEPFARAAYEARNGVLVDETGLVDHPVIPNSGASPDGLIGDDGLLEIKCPNSATHMETLLSRKPDSDYIAQMQWQMACTGRAWCDFVSFDPRMPENLQLCIIRVNRDAKQIETLEKEVIKFLAEVENQITQLKAIV